MTERSNVGRRTVCDYLHAMGKIQKAGKWVPHQLNDRKMEKRKTVCEVLLSRYERKIFLYRIVTGDGKWIYFECPKRRKSWVDPGQPLTLTARPNRFGKKIMMYPITHSESGQRHHFCTWLGTLVSPAILTRLGPFRLLLVFNNVSRPFHKTLQQLRTRREMAWWLDHLKRCMVFLGAHPRISTEMRKMCD